MPEIPQSRCEGEEGADRGEGDTGGRHRNGICGGGTGECGTGEGGAGGGARDGGDRGGAFGSGTSEDRAELLWECLHQYRVSKIGSAK